MENFVTAKVAAEKLGISLTALHRLCGRGTLASVMMGGARFIRKDILESYLADEEKQKRRRNGCLITQGTLALDLDQAVYRVQSIGSKKAGR